MHVLTLLTEFTPIIGEQFVMNVNRQAETQETKPLDATQARAPKAAGLA